MQNNMQDNIQNNMYGIEYSKPTVILLQESGIGTSEIAARTCYDSFDLSENESIKYLNEISNKEPRNELLNDTKMQINNIEHSNLLDDLAWTYFHHSIMEHANLTYLIKGTSRGVLQEHARHRIQAISVRSTRYTMSSIINAFVSCYYTHSDIDWFLNKIYSFDMFVTKGDYNYLEAKSIYDKLVFQLVKLGEEEFLKVAVAKSSLDFMKTDDCDLLFEKLENGKKKRNVGDAFKHIVSDNWEVDMVVTFNLRSLKNYFQLRDSGAAYFQIQWLAQEMKKVTPKKYLDLIIKDK